jgi:hypothetical protein
MLQPRKVLIKQKTNNDKNILPRKARLNGFGVLG